MGSALAGFVRVSIREARAARLAWLPLLYAALLAALLLGLPAPTPEDRARAGLEAAVALSFGLTVLWVGAFSVLSFPREKECGLDLLFSTKPVGPVVRVVGKFLGIALVGLAVVCVEGALGFAALRFILAGVEPSPAFASPGRYRSGRSEVFAGPNDSAPRDLARDEEFSPERPSRPVWIFDESPREGSACLSIESGIRIAQTQLEAGSVAVVARRGSGDSQFVRVRLFQDRPELVTVDPPGVGVLTVVLHPTGDAILYPDAESVRVRVAQGSFGASLLLAQAGVLGATLVVAAAGLFFGATCRPRVALLYTLVLGLAMTQVDAVRTFSRVVADPGEAKSELERSLGTLGEAGDPAHDHSDEPGLPTEVAWSVAGAISRGVAALLPDLARLDFREPLARGVQVTPRDLGPGLVTVLGATAAFLGLGALGLALGRGPGA